MSRIFLYLLFFLPSAFVHGSVNVTHQLLDGEWEFRRVGDASWLPATVPGNIYTDLLANRIIPDPFFGTNETAVQWVDTCTWEYRTTFDASADLLKRKNQIILFEGLDTYATVILNGKSILAADNMFRAWSADVSALLKEQGNQLEVRFDATARRAAERSAKYPYRLPGGDRVFARKAAFQWGWDFGPTFIGCGIWKRVSLDGWDHFVVRDVQVVRQSIRKSEAELQVAFTLEADGPCQARFKLATTNSDQEAVTQTCNLHKGVQTVKLGFEIENLKRWWTHQLGDPFCYDFLLEVNDPSGNATDYRWSTGIRTLELVQDKDREGSSFYFILNGVPVFMKGANVVPLDHFVHRIDSAREAKLIADAKSANMNMLRVWGGGIYPDDDFYESCDRNGILVWQDFMAACSMIPADTAFMINLQKEVTEQVIRLRNHPSLAIWCGNNESDEGWHNWGWQKEFKYTPQDSASVWKDYQSVFHQLIPSILKAEDPSRTYWPSSPSIGWGHAESLLSGDSHYWGVWWGMEPFSIYEKKVGRFMTEYGFQALPAMATLKQFAGNGELSDTLTTLRAHQKHPTGFETIKTYLDREYRPAKDFQSYVYLTQLLQTDGMTRAIIAHRRAKPYCMGTFFWQFNDTWPGISWSSRDYYGRRKMLQYTLPSVYSTLLISTRENANKVEVYVTSDSLDAYPARMELRILDTRGNVRWSEIVPAIIKPNTTSFICSRDKYKLVLPSDTVNAFLNIRILQDDKVICERSHFFCEPKNLKLMRPALSVRLVIAEDGAKQIELKSSTFVKSMELSWNGDPSVFDRNYSDMNGNERYLFPINSPDFKESNLNEIKYRSLIDTYTP